MQNQSRLAPKTGRHVLPNFKPATSASTPLLEYSQNILSSITLPADDFHGFQTIRPYNQFNVTLYS